MTCRLGRNQISLCVLMLLSAAGVDSGTRRLHGSALHLYDGFVRLALCSQLQVPRLHCTTCIIGHGSSHVPPAPQSNVFAVIRP